MHAFCIRPELICFVDVPVEVCLARIAAVRRGGGADKQTCLRTEMH